MTTETSRRPGPFSTGPIIGTPAQAPGPVESGERDARFDNQPPLGDRIMLEFEEDLRAEGLIERAAELAAAAGRAPACNDKTAAGKIGDFVKQCSVFEKSLEAVREKHNRPLIEARSSLKARSDAIYSPLAAAVERLREELNFFMRKEAERVRREQLAAEEEARRLRREAEERAKEKEEATGIPAETFVPDIQPRHIEEPVARGDYGSRVGTRVVYKHEIESVRQLPDRLLKHPRVVETLDKLIAAEIKAASGKCEIKGVRIWQEQAAVVR